MPQLSLYLDGETMESLRDGAGRERVSLSQYARCLIQNQAESAWPAGFWETYGALDDPTFVEPLELDVSLDDSISFDSPFE